MAIEKDLQHLALDEAKSSGDRLAFRLLVRWPDSGFASGFRHLAAAREDLQIFRPEICDSLLYLDATVTVQGLKDMDAFVGSVDRQYQEHTTRLIRKMGM